MFLSHIGFALELIAIAIGVSFLIWSLRNEGAGTVLAKVIGIVIVVLAVIDLLCTAYSSVLYGDFAYLRYSSMMPYMQQNSMMGGGMGMMPMMGGGMNNIQGTMPNAMCPMCASMMQGRMNMSGTAQQGTQGQMMGCPMMQGNMNMPGMMMPANTQSNSTTGKNAATQNQSNTSPH